MVTKRKPKKEWKSWQRLSNAVDMMIMTDSRKVWGAAAQEFYLAARLIAANTKPRDGAGKAPATKAKKAFDPVRLVAKHCEETPGLDRGMMYERIKRMVYKNKLSEKNANAAMDYYEEKGCPEKLGDEEEGSNGNEEEAEERVADPCLEEPGISHERWTIKRLLEMIKEGKISRPEGESRLKAYQRAGCQEGGKIA